MAIVPFSDRRAGVGVTSEYTGDIGVRTATGRGDLAYITCTPETWPSVFLAVSKHVAKRRVLLLQPFKYSPAFCIIQIEMFSKRKKKPSMF